MTYKEWEARLQARLKDARIGDVAGVLNYYREMYGDKHEAGHTDDEIISEFGTPDECAERIKRDEPEMLPELSERWSRVFSAVMRIALFAFIFIPALLTAVMGAVTLAACMLGGIAVALGGVGVGIYSVYMLFIGTAFNTVLIQFGLGMAMTGGGAVVCILFFFMTRYAVLSLIKIAKYYIEQKKGGRI